jgi:uncharacterized protein (TIGR03118 family)
MKLRQLSPALLMVSFTGFAHAAGHIQQNLVSNGAVPAAHIDADLKNPWGISFGPSTPFWVSDNGTGLSTLYNGQGVKQGLIVTIPGTPTGTAGTPTGTVFNGSPSNFSGDRFLFATEAGTIAGWQGGTTAALRVDKFGSASYKGLAISGDRIYASNFATGGIDVFNSGYTQITVPGGFTDPNLPAGYAPFNVQAIGGSLYVTYALRGANGDDVSGAGHGFVDEYNTDGVLQRRVVSGGVTTGAGSELNSPWGLALAPSSFGELSGKLLIGNFGDGKINAYDPVTGTLIGALKDAKGNPIVIDGLWALAFGNNGPGFDPNKLYFTAGINDEADGLFGSIMVPEPGTVVAFGAGLILLIATRRWQMDSQRRPQS